MTLENRSKTGAIAREASRQTRWKTGLGIVALSVSKGSRINRKPAEEGGSMNTPKEDSRVRLTFVVSGYEGSEPSYFLKRGVFIDSSEFQSSDQRGQSFGTESNEKEVILSASSSEKDILQ